MLKFILEIIGTVAFSVSGAVVGIRRKMDILGVTVLGVITAVGGGIIRDLLIGVTPPMAFQNPLYIIIAIAVAMIVFLPFISRRINLDHMLWVLIDAVGLGAFTMIGAASYASSGNMFLMVFLGVTTGVGGGVIRDICAGEIPMIFVRHFYACPCIISAALYVCLYKVNSDLAIALGFCVTVLLRLLAAKYKWHLPKAK